VSDGPASSRSSCSNDDGSLSIIDFYPRLYGSVALAVASAAIFRRLV
jgi:hypothetical protein